jgi:hypothetical protein
METYYWNTELPLATNTDTMNDFLDNHLGSYCGSDYKITEQDGTYAEIENKEGTNYGLHASGNGDFCSHKIEFDKLSY